jgi:hypothetical protein
MSRPRLIGLVVVVALAALIAWIANNTYWDDVVVPVSLRGEAGENAFYAAEQFSRKLGVTASHAHVLGTPPQDSIVMLSSWHWNLTARRREALEQWVANGGRLVADSSLIGGEQSFRAWTGISRAFKRIDDFEAIDPGEVEDDDADECEVVAGAARRDQYRMCDLDGVSYLVARSTPSWSLSSAVGLQAVRVAVGRGSVTVVNSAPFRYRTFLEGDHARLFVAATQLRRDDTVLFLSEDEHPTLLALMWREGSPVVLLSLALVALAMWRGGTRFGPPVAPDDTARRSLAEQISGTGQFALRYGGGESLHAATVRALTEAAARRISGYARLTPDERITALERVTGFDPMTIAGALRTGPRRTNDLQSAIALLDTARRRILSTEPGPIHGTH